MLIDRLKQSDQVNILEAVFRDIQKTHFSDEITSGLRSPLVPGGSIAGVATLCAIVIGDRPSLKGQILDWLARSQGGSIHTISLRRALVALYNIGWFHHWFYQQLFWLKMPLR